MPENIVATLQPHVLQICRKAPARIGEIMANVRQAVNNPTLPDATILTAICDLSDKGAILPKINPDGFLFYQAPAAPEEKPNA